MYAVGLLFSFLSDVAHRGSCLDIYLNKSCHQEGSNLLENVIAFSNLSLPLGKIVGRRSDAPKCHIDQTLGFDKCLKQPGD